MPIPRTHTAAVDRVRKLADLALEAQQGVEVNLTVDKYGTMEACAAMARSLQQSFCSMRARHRAKVVITNNIDPVCDYDALICQRLPLPMQRGWQVRFHREDANLEAWEIVDIASGATLTLESQENATYERLITKFMVEPENFTVADRKFVERIAPAFASERMPRDMSWSELHGHTELPEPDLTIIAQDDLADIPMDVDPFTGEKIEVDN